MLFNQLMSQPSKRKLSQLIKEWWNIYENNKKIGLDHLVIILLYSAGIEHDTFDMTTFPDEFLKRNIFSKDHDSSNVPISLQQFFKTLNTFADILLQRKSWTILQDSSFIFPLISVIEYMRGSPLDSVRAVSYFLGIKIFRHSHYLSEYLMTAYIPDKTTLVQKVEELRNKVNLNLRYSMRDNAAHLRMIPLKELLYWSEGNHEAMFEEHIRKYILRALSDSFIVNRKISLHIFQTIFEKPSVVNREKQQNLFKSLIPKLVISLRSNEELDCLILKIVNQTSQFLDVFITPDEDLNFSMCLYSDSGSVLDEAKTYFYNYHLKGKTGVNIINETLKFYKECPVKNASKLVKNFMAYYVAHTSWRDWELCLKFCFDDDVNDYLNIFYLYVSFINSPSFNDLDSSTTNKIKDEFSIYFSEHWLELMEMDKINMNSNAQVFMLKLATSFNVMKIFKKTQKKIIDWSLNKFYQSRNQEVLKECLLCINFLNSFNNNIEIDKMLISQVFTEFIEVLNFENEETELLNLSHYKAYLIIKIYEDDYENLWRNLVSLLEKGRDLEKVQLIISLLYHLALNKIKNYIDFKKQSDIHKKDSLSTEEQCFQSFILEAQITNCCSIVIQAASDFICNNSHHINENDNLAKMMLVPKLYGDLIRLSKSSPLSEFMSTLSDANVESYVIYCSRMMNTDCQRKGLSPLGNCCILLNDYVALTLEGKICISYFKFFIMNFDKINSHWLIIIKKLNFLINVKNNPIGAYAMINGLISFHNEKKENLVDEEKIKVKLSEITIFILNNLDNKEGKGYQKMVLHLYLYLKKLVLEGYIVFIELMEKMKSYLKK